MPTVPTENFWPPAGGTQVVEANLRRKLNFNQIDQDRINLIISETSPQSIIPSKINILWNQHDVDQPAVSRFRSKEYMEQYDLIVFVSHWQFQRYLDHFDLPIHNCVVIQNAIEENLEPPSMRGKKIKLIYVSTPWRGLELLIDSFELLDNDEVELEIFSSTEIYGSTFHSENKHRFTELFDRASQMRGVTCRGYVPNQEIRDSMRTAHIFAYPCIWAETSCVSAIEAGLSGLSMLVTNYGALPETCGPYANFVQFSRNYQSLKYSYAYGLEKAIAHYWDPINQEHLFHQQQYFKRFWTWEKRIVEWRGILQGLINMKKQTI